MVKVAAAAVAVLAFAGVLVVLVANARQKGKLSYCRNNLRMLGLMAHGELLSSADEPPTERGRAFWQWVREARYHNAGRKEWIRKGQLNPFGCPVLGGRPLDLSPLSRTDYAQLMSDPSTIDYRGPKALPEPLRGRVVMGADREGNHPSGGHVLLSDLSVSEKQEKALTVVADLWARAAAETSD